MSAKSTSPQEIEVIYDAIIENAKAVVKEIEEELPFQ